MYDYPLSYANFRDEELLNLAERIHTFIPEAQRELTAELNTRGLSVPSYQEEQLNKTWSEKKVTRSTGMLSSRIETLRIRP